MNEDAVEQNIERARTFFKKAEEVADTDNFDYAIEMYLEGLRLAPDALEDGHAPLRRLALIRQGKGGKKPSVMNKVKKARGKTPLDEMLNAEYLLAKDPDHLPYAEAMLKAAVAGGCTRTAEWIASLVFDANRASDKPSLATYLLLKDSYVKLNKFTEAVAAFERAVEMKPRDDAMKDQLRDLTAQMTVEKGGYDQDGDFRKSIKDKAVQDQLHAQENVVRTADVRRKTVDLARKEFQKNANPSTVFKLADALLDMEDDKAGAEAVAILEDQYTKTADFSFKRKQGEAKLKCLKDRIKKIKALLLSQPDDEQLRKDAEQLTKKYTEIEIDHWRLCVQNYPTDSRVKYQLGVCLLRVGSYDEALPMLQEAQKDPRYKLSAMDKTGLCFLLKGWFDDAIDIFEQAFEACELKDSPVGKEIRYNLARSYEAAGKKDLALETYRKLAQLDFSFKDVKQRIDKLRSPGA